MRSRVTLSMVAGILLLAGGNASGNVMGSVSDGTFDHAPCVAPVQCTGQGTSTFFWGDTGSSLTFTGTKNFDYPRNQKVTIGTFTFHNTPLTAGTEVSSGLTVTFSLGDVTATGADACNGCPFNTLYDFTGFELTLNLHNTPNIPNDPVASRDEIIVTGVLQGLFQNGVLQNPQPASVTFSPNVFRVDEGFTNSVDVLAEFDDVSLCCYDPASVRDRAHGDVVVPEPSTLVLLSGVALVLVLILARQRRSRGSRGKARVA